MTIDEPRMTLSELNALSDVAAYDALLRCCGSRAWASSVAADRPFRDLNAVFSSAERAWSFTTDEEKLEAFSHHPRIGDGASLRAKFNATASWAKDEQSGTSTASETTLNELARLNREYEKRFGHVFLIFATGKTADEMLAALMKRIANTPQAELANAATEQMKITRLRLEKLLK